MNPFCKKSILLNINSNLLVILCELFYFIKTELNIDIILRKYNLTTLKKNGTTINRVLVDHLASFLLFLWTVGFSLR